jgi:stage II sporulation protein D
MRASSTVLAVLLICGVVLGEDVRVKLTKQDGDKVVTMPLDRYVAAVLAGESSVFRSDEALKAMAVAARTYAVRLRGRHAKEGFDFCGTTHCQRVDLKAVTARLEGIAEDTAGELLWYEGKPAFACYARDCGGRTEDAGAVWPDLAASYLKSHEDPYCLRSGGSAWQWAGTPQDILNALRQSELRTPRVLEQISFRQTTASGRAHILALIGDGQTVAVSASSFRFAIGRGLGWDTLRSDTYQVRFTNGRFLFQGSGAGHGVGLCQRGADQMGTEGHPYREILSFYYPGTLAGLTGRGVKWTRMGGEFIAVMTTQPGQDAGIVEKAERTVRALSDRTHLELPRRIEIRVYPDLDTFRNATGAPGSVAGQTRGTRIDLQPVAVLQGRGVFDSTLRHELLHVLVEHRARPGLPVWFREGLVEYLDGKGQGRVKNLVNRYGADAVMGWLVRGLPPELNDSSSSHATTKSK